VLADLTTAIEARDPCMLGHSARVAKLAVTLGRTLGWASERVEALRLSGLLHDVGKLTICKRVLAKAGPLDRHELEAVRAHPVTGLRLLQPVASARAALACVLFHHERWDGGGYPTGRAGDEIPLDARVLAVADAYDAMTTTRPYRRALSKHEALAEVARCAGTQFDPVLATLFVALWSEAVPATSAAV
jgi:HD-GYP domain-containing protein (c-di-GMP phosphodiesterase class II)